MSAQAVVVFDWLLGQDLNSLKARSDWFHAKPNLYLHERNTGAHGGDLEKGGEGNDRSGSKQTYVSHVS